MNMVLQTEPVLEHPVAQVAEVFMCRPIAHVRLQTGPFLELKLANAAIVLRTLF